MTSINPDTFLDYGPLPTLPSQIERVMDQAARTSAMDYNIVKMIQFDPAIAAQVVQMANAPLYGYSRQISSLQQAAGLLGPGVIKSLILTTPMLERFSGTDATYKSKIDYVKLINHASTTGAVAGGLGNLLVGFESDVCFTAGLIHDLGKIALAVFQPRMFMEVCDYVQSRKVPLSLAEKEVMGFTHYDIGYAVGRNREYPDSLLATFQDPMDRDAPENDAPMRMVIQLARMLAIEWGFDDGTGQVETADRSKICEALHLTEEELQRCGEDVKPGLDWVVNS